MSRNRISIDSLQEEIQAIVTEYQEEVQDNLNEAGKETAEKVVARLKETSPSNPYTTRKKYKNGWTYEENKTIGTAMEYVIYNKNKPSLTHILENGRAKVGGGRVEGIPHIKPAEEYGIDLFIKLTEGKLGKNG